MDIVNVLIVLTKIVSVFSIGVGVVVLIGMFLFGLKDSLIELMAKAVLFVAIGGVYFCLPTELLQAVFVGFKYNSIGANVVWAVTVACVSGVGYWFIKRYKEDIEKRVNGGNAEQVVDS